MAKSIIIRIAIVLAGVLVVLLGRGLFFYSGFYSPPPSEIPSYERIAVPTAPSTEFSDVYEEGEGVILIDWAHKNAFAKEELNVLLLRLVSRGLTIKFFTAEDDLKSELLGEEEEEVDLEGESLDEEKDTGEVDQGEELLDEEGEEREDLEREDLEREELEREELEGEELEEEEEMEEELPGAFIVVCPQSEFSKEEKKAIDEFVSKGGRLLLIADPTRSSQVNNVSLKFGLIFESDYLYNMKESESNYRNIFIMEFKENEITKNLEKIALYTAGSISSADSGIAFVDENTFSSAVETREELSPVALAQESNVLAIYDLTFMNEPYSGVLDNSQLISNIADWLASH
ncbi:hypothetical protein ACFLYG_02040 [Chloroflexota bacterium]